MSTATEEPEEKLTKKALTADHPTLQSLTLRLTDDGSGSSEDTTPLT